MSVAQVGTVHGDVLDVLRQLPADSVDACTTSPPYWGRRDYGFDGQLGTGPLHEYLETLADVFDEVARVLNPAGICWVNLGDTAVGSGGAGGDYNEGGNYNGRNRYRQGPATIRVVDPGTLEGWRLAKLSDGQWADVPGRFAHELQGRGWLLRSIVVWNKGRPVREDVHHVRRPKEQHEVVLMLTRSTAGATRFEVPHDHPEPQRIGDVWTIAAARGLEAVGQAPWPSELPRRMLELSGAPGVVLDPFVGSGNTAVAAGVMGWHTLGIDLDPVAVAACPGGQLTVAEAAAWLGSLRPWRTDQWAKHQRAAEERHAAECICSIPAEQYRTDCTVHGALALAERGTLPTG